MVAMHVPRWFVAVAFMFMLVTTSASAQPRSRVQALGGPRVMKHNERPEAQVFHTTVWNVGSNSTRGATVTLSCGPFENQSDPDQLVDAGLRLWVRASRNSSNWRFDRVEGRTKVASGRRVAFVTAMSEGEGAGVIELEVTFLGADVVDLVEGDYSTTVTGTITAH